MQSDDRFHWHYQHGFEIETQHPAAGVVLLAVRGGVDVCTSLGLMESLIEAFAEHPEVIAVDLGDLRSIDSAGLRVLLHGARHIEEGGVRFVVVLPADHGLAHLPQLDGMHRAIAVHESLEDALGPWLDQAGELPAGV
jgi:anti-anti-sigma factor